jgi:hypothetical protein
MAEKIYCGKGKKGNYGVKLNLCITDLEQYITTATNGKRYIRLELNEMRQPDQWGNTHSVTVDTWKPNQGVATDHSNAEADGYAPQGNPDDLPF